MSRRNSAGIITAAATFAAVVLFSRRATGATGELVPAQGGLLAPELEMVDAAPDDGDYLPDPALIDWEIPVDISGVQAVSDPLFSFLYMLRCCEHRMEDVSNDLDYHTFYGGTYFNNMSDHPVLTGEKQGVPLPAQMCINAGFPSGNCVSTAAGAYQITLPTWREFRAAGSWGPLLTDFSIESQDEAARRILFKLGALSLIRQGKIPAAIRKAATRWASLPGSSAGQRTRSMEFAVAKYNEGNSA